MISIGSFKDISDKYDEIWLIVRSLKEMPRCGDVPIYHIPALSPSPDLFHRYLSLRDAGAWNKQTFETIYKPIFLEEMKKPEASGALGFLKQRAHNKHILLACYCPSDEMCHRSIVYQLVLQETFYMLVAGSRGYNNYTEMCQVLDFLLKNQVAQGRKIVIVSGGARGADELAERYADERGYEKHIMPADWDKYGKSAGYRRNNDMHLYISAPSDRKRGCVCFWDMQSPGTKHNFKLAKDYGTTLRVFDTVNHRFLSEEEVQRHT